MERNGIEEEAREKKKYDGVRTEKGGEENMR